ncbi:SART-1 protein [Endogone sp. FLAS-F59071]|nr:SART-1 protein [Endogone sp. FLAS-F59071]|eukprot:RUS15975.1 SART-1 protein [Endogone sp. FLAS-F59071]
MADTAIVTENLSLDETNKLRASLGLPPLSADSDAAVSREEEAHENWAKYRDEKDKEAKEKEIKERIEKSKSRKKLAEKLTGKGLGELSDNEDESALTWIKKSRKREKELAMKRAKELAEMDEMFEKNGTEYSAADLTGLQVAHDLSQFEEGDETILTLKDSTILENEEEGDQLTSVQMEDRERLQKNLDNKKKKPGYLAYDDEEFTLGGGQKRNILSQYDEEIDEIKKKTFVIGEDGSASTDLEAAKKSISEKLKAQAVNLSYESMYREPLRDAKWFFAHRQPKDLYLSNLFLSPICVTIEMKEIKDYYTKEEADVTFKKLKKKKKARKKTEEQEHVEDSNGITVEDNGKLAPMEEDDKEPASTTAEVSFVDDDDLQQALARTRRIANKKKKGTVEISMEYIERSVSRNHVGDQDDEDIGATSGGLVISDTSEFVNSLQDAPVISVRTVERAERARSLTPVAMEEAMEDYHPEDEDVNMTVKEEGEEGERKTKKETEEAPVAAVIEEEPLVNSGMAATLALLSQKGIYQQPTEEQNEKDRIGADRAKWLAEQRKKDLQREREREREKKRDKERAAAAGRGGGSSRELDREKEYEASYRDREKARELEQRMVNYKPDVNLEYVDEFGRQMTTKEAFRHLSHKFHGKTSGKAKTEKRLKKLEEERRLLSMNSADTPLNMSTALQERQRATGSAHVVLSVGNRGVLPPNISMSEVQSTSASGKGRARSGSASTIKEVPALVTINAPSSVPTGGSGDGSGGEGSSALGVAGREKVTFGLKRKAVDAAAEGPVTKKEKK